MDNFFVSKRTAARDFENLIKKDITIQIGITGRGTEYSLKWGHKGAKRAKWLANGKYG